MNIDLESLPGGEGSISQTKVTGGSSDVPAKFGRGDIFYWIPSKCVWGMVVIPRSRKAVSGCCRDGLSLQRMKKCS